MSFIDRASEAISAIPYETLGKAWIMIIGAGAVTYLLERMGALAFKAYELLIIGKKK